MMYLVFSFLIVFVIAILKFVLPLFISRTQRVLYADLENMERKTAISDEAGIIRFVFIPKSMRQNESFVLIRLPIHGQYIIQTISVWVETNSKSVLLDDNLVFPAHKFVKPLKFGDLGCFDFKLPIKNIDLPNRFNMIVNVEAFNYLTKKKVQLNKSLQLRVSSQWGFYGFFMK